MVRLPRVLIIVWVPLTVLEIIDTLSPRPGMMSAFSRKEWFLLLPCTWDCVSGTISVHDLRTPSPL